MTALKWPLRAVQPLAAWPPRAPGEAPTEFIREAVLNTVSGYLVNCWHELLRVKHASVPADMPRQERRMRRGLPNFPAMETLSLPPMPPPTANFGD
jgi:hypothetical protein